ncbi:MAG TPA: pitrilysin family protein [Gemmatimonadota bacterium]|nr:pitrilysin family protein [Gemmatimonadota bacterium]
MGLDHGRHVLSAGATVLARPLETNDIVAIRAVLPMGSLYERDPEAGISSLVQSVLPRGTLTRSADALHDALADLGADLDSGSGSDLGSISLRATASGWEPALDLFLETLTEPAFADDEVATEIEQALGALEAREDQLMVRVVDLFREQLYGSHPYHKPALGYRETVRGFDRDQVIAAARRFYRPIPPIVVAVGRFDPDRLVARMEAAFGRTPLAPPEPRPFAPTTFGGARRLDLDRQAAYLVHGYPAPDYNDPDYPVARLLDAILGGSMSSRLFIELREKRSLAYQVSSIYNDQLDGSFIAAYIITDPDRAGEAAHGLAREFERIVDEPVREEEIEAARRYLKGSYLIGAETNMAQAVRLGLYEAYGLGQDFGDRWLTAIEAVTPERIQALGQRYFKGEPVRAYVVPRGIAALLPASSGS